MRGRPPIVRGVHRLARAYGWSEPQVLALLLTRRAEYLALLDAENDAGLTAALELGE